MVLCTHVDLSTLAGVARSPVNVLAGCVGTNKLYGLDVLVGADGGDRFVAALDNVDDTIWHARLLEEVNENL